MSRKKIIYTTVVLSAAVLGWFLVHRHPAPPATLQTPIAQTEKAMPTKDQASKSLAEPIGSTLAPTPDDPAVVRFRQLWAEMMRPDGLRDPMAYKNLHHLIYGTDPEVMAELIAQYDPANASARKTVVELLSSITMTPETLEFALRLVASGDVTQRRDAFASMPRLPGMTTDMRELYVSTLVGEKDPLILNSALATLAATEPHADDAPQVVKAIQAAAGNQDPQVRAACLHALAKWDRDGLEAVAEESFNPSESSLVHKAAAAAVAEAGIVSPALKSSLLALVASPTEEPNTRQQAWATLEDHFTLSAQDRETIQNAQLEMHWKQVAAQMSPPPQGK